MLKLDLTLLASGLILNKRVRYWVSTQSNGRCAKPKWRHAHGLPT